MNKLTPEQRVYEELTKYLWDIGIELEEHESDKIAKILTANTAEDEPIEPQMSHTQIAKQVYERYCDAMKPPIVAVISFPDWLQQEDE